MLRHLIWPKMNDSKHVICPRGRRDFVRKLAAGLLGAALALVPAGAGLGVILAPLRRRLGTDDAVRVTTLDALPEDGVPRKFPVVATKRDGWTQYPLATVGAVFLRRNPGGKIQAFNAVCPHAGCLVGLAPDRTGYFVLATTVHSHSTGRWAGRPVLRHADWMRSRWKFGMRRKYGSSSGISRWERRSEFLWLRWRDEDTCV